MAEGGAWVAGEGAWAVDAGGWVLRGVEHPATTIAAKRMEREKTPAGNAIFCMSHSTSFQLRGRLLGIVASRRMRGGEAGW